MKDNLPSILILSGVRGDTRRYRTFHLYEQARLLGLDCELSHTTDRDLRKKVDRSSVIILHRASFNRQIDWLIQEMHHKDGILIQDIDDLLFEPEAFKYINSIDFSDPVRSALYQQEMHLYRKTAEACDGVITSTGYLAERISQLGKPVRVHRNAFSMEMLDISEKTFLIQKNSDSGIVIGYASGTATHNQDFALIKPALKSTLLHFPTSELWLVGPVDPGDDWGDLAARIHHKKLVAWRNLPEILSRFDINLAPLCIDNPFGESKSEIKYVEAALVRVPTIASPSEAFKVAIKQAETGYLAHDIPEWEHALAALIQQPKLCQQVGEAAFVDVMQRYHPLIRAKELEETLNALIGVKLELPRKDITAADINDGSNSPYWRSVNFEKSPTLLQQGWYTLRYRGLSILMKQIWIFLRRLAAPLIPFRKIA